MTGTIKTELNSALICHGFILTNWAKIKTTNYVHAKKYLHCGTSKNNGPLFTLSLKVEKRTRKSLNGFLVQMGTQENQLKCLTIQ